MFLWATLSGVQVFGEAHKDKKRQLLPYVLKGAQDKLRTVFGAELIEYRRKDKKKGTVLYFLQRSLAQIMLSCDRQIPLPVLVYIIYRAVCMQR